LLHLESGQGGKKDFHKIIILGIILLIASCAEEHSNPNRNLTIEAFSRLKTPQYVLNLAKIDKALDRLAANDKDSMLADSRTRAYYKEGGRLVWLTLLGPSVQADTLVAALGRDIAVMGFSERAFRKDEIERDLQRLRTLELGEENINDVAARLEYNLTKSYLRYVIGQRFGYTNPYWVLNRFTPTATDSTGKALGYQRLFDVNVERPSKRFHLVALQKVSNDSLSEYFREIAPKDSFYHRLLGELKTGQWNRHRLLVNMERRRWRTSHPRQGGKYVIVNVPSYHLTACSPDTSFVLKIGCGALKTKTPLLTSAINRIDLNPNWIIPMSIVKKDIAPHAGNASYFSRRNYFITDRNTGVQVDVGYATRADLESGRYRVQQAGGNGNSLGNIVFRFPNNFSVYLHDTSSRGVFSREDRSVSHGCVRVEHPFTLAQFLLGKPNDWKPDTLKSNISVSPSVPLFITYYTIYPDSIGNLHGYPDIYGYDAAIERELKSYLP